MGVKLETATMHSLAGKNIPASPRASHISSCRAAHASHGLPADYRPIKKSSHTATTE
mgnify:CR=1 FL=1